MKENGFEIIKDKDNKDKTTTRQDRKLLFCERKSDHIICVFKTQDATFTDEFKRLLTVSRKDLAPLPLVLFEQISYINTRKKPKTRYGYIMKYVPGPTLMKNDIDNPVVISDIIKLCISLSGMGITAHDLNISNFMYSTMKRKQLWRIDMDLQGRKARNRSDLWRGNMSFYDKNLKTNLGNHYDPDRKCHMLWASQASTSIAIGSFTFFQDEYERLHPVKHNDIISLERKYTSLSLFEFIQLCHNGNDTDINLIVKHIYNLHRDIKNAYLKFLNNTPEVI